MRKTEMCAAVAIRSDALTKRQYEFNWTEEKNSILAIFFRFHIIPRRFNIKSLLHAATLNSIHLHQIDTVHFQIACDLSLLKLHLYQNWHRLTFIGIISCSMIVY